jgi:autotransporter-associated beta strand protein
MLNKTGIPFTIELITFTSISRGRKSWGMSQWLARHEMPRSFRRSEIVVWSYLQLGFEFSCHRFDRSFSLAFRLFNPENPITGSEKLIPAARRFIMPSAKKLGERTRIKLHSSQQKSRFFFRPRLEALEDRCLPSTANIWAAPAGPPSNWNTAANWSLSHVPTSSEIATFNSTSQTFCLIDAPATGTNTISGLNITSLYGGQIQDTADLIIGSDGFVQAGGVFFIDFFMPGTTTITDAGNWSEAVPPPFGGFIAGPGATVDFNSVTSQTILGNNTQFFNLTHSGAGTLNLTAGPNPFLPIAGNFTNSSGTVDAHGASLMIGGNWTDASSVVNLGTVTFNPFSPVPQTISSNSDFNNVTYIGPPPALLQLLTPVTLTGNFTVSSGTFDANGQNMTVAGNWSNAGTVENTATVFFDGPDQTLQLLDSGGSPFKDVVHNGLTILKLMTNPLTVTGTLDNVDGTLDPNDQSVTVTGLTSIIASAMLNSGNSPTETITLNGGLLITGAALNSGPGRTILGAGVTASSGFNVSSTIMGNLDLGGADRTFTVSVGTEIPDLIVLARVTNGGIIKDGDGIMQLANTNQYSGDTTINAGILDVSQDGALGSGGQILGPTLTILGNTGDGSIDFTGDVRDISSSQVRVGTGGNDVAGEADIFFFALPKLTSPASILGAQLNLQYLGISQFTMTVTPEFNVDLFGLGARSTTTIAARQLPHISSKKTPWTSTPPGIAWRFRASRINYRPEF